MGKRRVFAKEFKEEACKLVIEEKQKISETARDLGIGQGMLGQWVKASRYASSNPEADSERQRVLGCNPIEYICICIRFRNLRI